MFLHSGASLHGHEYHTPHNQPRKKPFLRSALPNPILRSNSSATLPNTFTSSSSPPSRPLARRRPVSEAYVRPISALLHDETRPRAAVPSAPVVRFKDLDVADTLIKSPMPEEDRSSYDSDASQASCSTPRRGKRRAIAARGSTNYLVAVPPPNPSSKKTLFKTIRPRLLLQLQQLTANQRAKPTIDVFPASLIAGPLATAPYIHRFPRMFGAKGELGPRDLILVRSEDYTADVKEGGECSGSRKQPVAVLSPGRGQADVGEIVLDGGSVWKCSIQKSHYNFVHIDEHGSSLTVRWVKRSVSKRASSTSPVSPGFPPILSAPIASSSTDTLESDYRYTFSIINPLQRRHPVLATLSPQSLEVYDEYTTPSSSSGRYPPSRPVSGAFDSGYSARDPPPSPLSSNESCTQRETHIIDEDTKQLIVVTGLWLALRLGLSPDSTDGGESASCSQETPRITPSSTFQSTLQTLPRRQTTSNASSSPSLQVQPTRIRRAMSTGAAFMQRRRKDRSEAPSGTVTVVEPGKISVMENAIKENVSAPVAPCPVQKQARRLSWFKRLTH